MSDIAIRVEGLSKQFQLGATERYRTLRDTLTDAVTAPFRRLGKNAKQEAEARTIWALNDVSFDVKHGEVIGIIGRNGAGKSTLLKILSRITEPTKGQVEIHGRVGSLLEVGTGFHPELSGRENIFLNGAILGMKKAEIIRKFDEIVAFAEVDTFIDTPVKHYSSGMYVRLAFAVAAHMETEILIVDEVLAVGDGEFQKKCLRRMDDVAKHGRTVLFVSHNIGAVRYLCQSAIWLDNGAVKLIGPSGEVTGRYLEGDVNPGGDVVESQHLQGSQEVRIERSVLTSLRDEAKNTFLIGEPIRLTLDYTVRVPASATFWILVSSAEGTMVLSSFQRDCAPPLLLSKSGSISVVVDGPSFLPGTYILTAGIFGAGGAIIDWVESIAKFQVLTQFADGKPFDHRYGIVTQQFAWNLA